MRIASPLRYWDGSRPLVPPLETKTRPPIFQMAPFLEHVSRAGIEDFEYSKKRDSKGEGDFYLVHPREEENEFLVSVEFTGWRRKIPVARDERRDFLFIPAYVNFNLSLWDVMSRINLYFFAASNWDFFLEATWWLKMNFPYKKIYIYILPFINHVFNNGFIYPSAWMIFIKIILKVNLH